MSDFTFRIVAKHTEPPFASVEVSIPNIDDRVNLMFTPDEWTAFKSLLMPSAKADFTITEVDEHGRTIKE